jgi:hypothetical protein
VVKQLVNKSASADLRAINQLTDIVERVDQQAGASPATRRHPPSARPTRRSLPSLKGKWSGLSEPRSRPRRPKKRRTALRVSWT